MTMPRLLRFLPVLAFLALAPSSAVAQQGPLVAVVGTGDAFVISLVDENGSRVTNLDPGTYTIQVSDRSELHNIHLSGPQVNQTTTVGQITEATWTVTFVDGRYTYVCDAHPSSMRGTFVVGNPPTELGELEAQVGPGAKIALKRRGVRVRTVPAGRYRIAVRDRTRKDNFHLLGAGVNRRSGVAFTGRVRWTVSLRAGKTYRYRSDAHPRLSGALRAR